MQSNKPKAIIYEEQTFNVGEDVLLKAPQKIITLLYLKITVKLAIYTQLTEMTMA